MHHLGASFSPETSSPLTPGPLSSHSGAADEASYLLRPVLLHTDLWADSTSPPTPSFCQLHCLLNSRSLSTACTSRLLCPRELVPSSWSWISGDKEENRPHSLPLRSLASPDRVCWERPCCKAACKALSPAPPHLSGCFLLLSLTQNSGFFMSFLQVRTRGFSPPGMPSTGPPSRCSDQLLRSLTAGPEPSLSPFSTSLASPAREQI